MIGMEMKGKRDGGVRGRGERGLRERMNHTGSSEGRQTRRMKQQGEKPHRVFNL